MSWGLQMGPIHLALAVRPTLQNQLAIPKKPEKIIGKKTLNMNLVLANTLKKYHKS